AGKGAFEQYVTGSADATDPSITNNAFASVGEDMAIVAYDSKSGTAMAYVGIDTAVLQVATAAVGTGTEANARGRLVVGEDLAIQATAVHIPDGGGDAAAAAFVNSGVVQGI